MGAINRFFKRLQRRREAADWRERHVGEGTRLAETVQVLGWSMVNIGRHCLICDDTLINPRNTPGDGVRVQIGDFCLIGRRNFLSPGSLLTIGDYCLTGSDCSFLGSDHQHDNPFAPYITNGNTTGGEIRLGANCWLGAAVTILKGVTVGHGSIIGAGAMVTKDVPPFTIAIGHPAKVVRRFDVAKGSWVDAADFSAEAETRIPTQQDYLADLRRTHPKVSLPAAALGREAGDLA